ncbi:Ubiquitin [Linnemannia schmuckeri]|uniref:Ubiquitin n=1 Tax=Linnemannia schmuckeri TaxID=64567 RepID=A0A9P5RW32_9FUNG|nr:Ubiquitin [Linnemannia schmuckeri]
MASADTIEVMLAGRPGESVIVPYIAKEPIYNIIQRIAMKLQETKSDYNYQELYLQGFHLEYPQLPLADYRVLGGTLTYQSIKKGDMSIFVRNVIGDKSLCIGCNPSDTILNIKKILFKREGVPLAQLLMLHRGKALRDDDATLESLGVRRISTLTMLTRVRGGIGLTLSLPIRFADVSSRDNVLNVRLATHASPGRTVNRGTNIERHLPIHFGAIEFSREKFCCPNCLSFNTTVPFTAGFWNCKYRFHGLKADGTQFTAKWTIVDNPEAYRFFKPEKQIGRTRLVIESAALDREDDCPLCLRRMVDNIATLDCDHRFHEFWKFAQGLENCSSCEFQELFSNSKKYFSGGLRLRLSQ